jgi:hypothetical protein
MVFNLNTESHYLQIVYYSIYTSDVFCSNPTPCPLLHFYLTFLENQLSCSWCEYPSTLVPGLLTTSHPLLVLPPFHSHRSSYNIYTADIINIIRPRLTQWYPTTYFAFSTSQLLIVVSFFIYAIVSCFIFHLFSDYLFIYRSSCLLLPYTEVPALCLQFCRERDRWLRERYSGV